MPLQAILAEVRLEAENEVARIIAERDKVVAEITAAAHEEADRVEAEAAASLSERLLAAAAVVENRAALHVERRLQDAKEEIFREILRRACSRLDRLRNEPRYPRLLRTLLDECLRALPDAGAVMVDPRDRAVAASLIAEVDPSLRLDTSLETSGGIAVRSPTGGFVWNTIDERLHRADRELRMLVARAIPELAGSRPVVGAGP